MYQVQRVRGRLTRPDDPREYLLQAEQRPPHRAGREAVLRRRSTDARQPQRPPPKAREGGRARRLGEGFQVGEEVLALASGQSSPALRLQLGDVVAEQLLFVQWNGHAVHPEVLHRGFRI